jgi:hypothetical protein
LNGKALKIEHTIAGMLGVGSIEQNLTFYSEILLFQVAISLKDSYGFKKV